MHKITATTLKKTQHGVGRATRTLASDLAYMLFEHEAKDHVSDDDIDETISNLGEMAATVPATAGAIVQALESDSSLTGIQKEHARAALRNLEELRLQVDNTIAAFDEIVSTAVGADRAERFAAQSAALRLLGNVVSRGRIIWENLFFMRNVHARERVTLRLSARESRTAAENADAREQMMADADARADAERAVVEIRDDSGEVLYRTGPGIKPGRKRVKWEWRPKPAGPTISFARPLSEGEQQIVYEWTRHGTSLRELSEILGIGVVEVKKPETVEEAMTANPGSDDEAAINHFLWTI